MSDIEFFFTGAIDEWVSALPSYQARTIREMIANEGDPAVVAEKWLGASIAENTVPLGAVRVGADVFYDNLLKELKKLLCTREAYAAEKKGLIKQLSLGRTAAATYIASAISPEIHVSSTILVPALVLIFAVISNAGSESICAALTEMITKRQEKAALANQDGIK